MGDVLLELVGVGGVWVGPTQEPRIAPALRKVWNFPGVSFGSREGREIRDSQDLLSWFAMKGSSLSLVCTAFGL